MHVRLLIDPPLDGPTNMARDEALMLLHARGGTLPTLRLYRWSPACLSLGRFQRGSEIERRRCDEVGVHVVRRPSGGRALLHDDELTYALVVRADSPLGRGSILESYKRISTALLAGLKRLGAEVELAHVRRPIGGQRPPAKEAGASHELPVAHHRLSAAGRPSSAACYDTPAAYELTVGGRKLVGSAQTRCEGAVLQHGAIPLSPHADRLSALLANRPLQLASQMIALNEALGTAARFNDVAHALTAGFAVSQGMTLERGEWTAEELDVAAELHETKYTSETWTWGR